MNVKLSDGSYIVKDKNLSSFTTEEEDNYARKDVPFDLQTALTEQGAKYQTAPVWQPYSVADGNLVTGQNPASAKGVGEKMVAILEAQ